MTCTYVHASLHYLVEICEGGGEVVSLLRHHYSFYEDWISIELKHIQDFFK